MSRIKTLVVSIGVLSVAFGGSAFAGHRHHLEACFATTVKMKSACRADIVDDYFTQTAKCLNSDEPWACAWEALQELGEAREDCNDQAEARNSLCERLPDAGPYIADLDPNDFNGVNGTCPTGQNTYFPLIPGTVTTFVNETDEEETVIVTVTDETREIEGIEAIIVNDRVFEGLPDDDGNPTGDPIEDTDDYYAIDNECNVWYLGEIAKNFEDGYLVDLEGSFVWGRDDAQPGLIMKADPQVGDVYRQEMALGDAEDAAEVLSVDADIIVDGEIYELEVEGEDVSCDGACLLTDDFVGNELDSSELKYFVPGVGVVAEQTPDGELVLELIKIERP